MTNFLFILAAVLIIVCCLLWLAGSACLMGKSHRIQKDIDVLFGDVGELADAAKKVLKRFGVEKYRLGADFSGENYPPENDDRQWRHSSQYHFPYFE